MASTATLVGTTYVITGTEHTASGKAHRWRNTLVFSADWTSITMKGETETAGKWWTGLEGSGSRTQPKQSATAPGEPRAGARSC